MNTTSIQKAWATSEIYYSNIWQLRTWIQPYQKTKVLSSCLLWVCTASYQIRFIPCCVPYSTMGPILLSWKGNLGLKACSPLQRTPLLEQFEGHKGNDTGAWRQLHLWHVHRKLKGQTQTLPKKSETYCTVKNSEGCCRFLYEREKEINIWINKFSFWRRVNKRYI